MAKLNGVPVDDPIVDTTVSELEYGIQMENEGGKATWMECFSERNLLWKRTMNGIMLQFIQQLNGQNFYCEPSASRLMLFKADIKAYRLLRRHVLPVRRYRAFAILHSSHSGWCFCRWNYCTS